MAILSGLSGLGINENDRVLEPMSKDTRDAAVAIKKIVKNNKFVLVTTASHILGFYGWLRAIKNEY